MLSVFADWITYGASIIHLASPDGTNMPRVVEYARIMAGYQVGLDVRTNRLVMASEASAPACRARSSRRRSRSAAPDGGVRRIAIGDLRSTPARGSPDRRRPSRAGDLPAGGALRRVIDAG